MDISTTYDDTANKLYEYYQKLLFDKSTLFVYEDYEHLQYVISSKNTLVDISFNEIYDSNGDLKELADIKYINKEYISLIHSDQSRFNYIGNNSIDISFSHKTNTKKHKYAYTCMTNTTSYEMRFKTYLIFNSEKNDIIEILKEMLSKISKSKYKKLTNLLSESGVKLSVHNLLSKLFDISLKRSIAIYKDISVKNKYLNNDLYKNSFIEIPIKKYMIVNKEYLTFKNKKSH